MYSFIPFHLWCHSPWPPSEDASVLLTLLLFSLILLFLGSLTYLSGRRLPVLFLFLPLALYYEVSVKNLFWQPFIFYCYNPPILVF